MKVERYYKVTCKCGHTGSKKTYIPITFAIKAVDGRETASKARQIPRCKHHHKDCILEVVKCTYEDFLAQIKINDSNPYLSCSCIQDQKLLNIEDQLVEDPHYVNRKDKKKNYDDERSVYYYGKKRIKHPKKYMTNIYYNQSRLMEAY